MLSKEKDLLYICFNKELLDLKLSFIEKELSLFAKHFTKEQKDRIKELLKDEDRKSELKEVQESFKKMKANISMNKEQIWT